MQTSFFVIAIIALILLLAIQLIRMNTYVLKIRKSKDLNQTEIKEESEWQFIKGLY